MTNEVNNQWEKFFDSHAPFYMQNTFTRNTLAEVDFLVEMLSLPTSAKILDVGCGTGRHAVELAKRGYDVTGVDISRGMLAEAKKAADSAGVSVTLIRCDATKFNADKQFDAAVCLCEGAFALAGADEDPEEHDRSILKNIHTTLKIDAPFIMTTLNGYKKIRSLSQKDIDSGDFDPVTMEHHLTEEFELPGGNKRMTYKERLYIAPELAKLIESEGFEVEHIWGGTAGRWARRKIDLDEMEVMIVARKRETTVQYR